MDFQKYKDRQRETKRYPGALRAYLLYDENDSDRIEFFKQNFTNINFLVNSSDCDIISLIDEIDYILVFFSKDGLKNIEFLDVLLKCYERKNDKKIIGFIIDEEIRDEEKRLELYKYYTQRYIKADDLIRAGIINEDVRRIARTYEDSREKVGNLLNTILKYEGNTKVCPEDQFEGLLKKDGRKGLRIRNGREKNDKAIKEERPVGIQYNNCNIINTERNHSPINVLIDADNNTVTQNNGIRKDEFEMICEEICRGIGSLNEENRERFMDMLDNVKKEYREEKQKPKERLGKCLNFIVPMMTFANEAPGLFDNLQKLQSFIFTNLK